MTLLEALHIKDKQRSQAEEQAEARSRKLYAELPQLEEVDKKLAESGPAMIKAALSRDPSALEEVKKANLELQAMRRDILTSNGYRPDEDAPVYTCAVCADTGYVGEKVCFCVRKEITLSAYISAGLGKGLVDKTFDNFSLQYYTGEDRARMEKNLAACKEYVANFTPESKPVLFMGKTGLGKTPLSAAIAGGVAAKGYRVIYETSQKLFDTYESARFGRENAPDTEKYESCDLLLIDDLGAECGSQYTAATFFNLLNTRLMQNKPTLINTNLNRAQLEKNYGERVLSRLLGEFRVLLFAGKDVRMQKLAEKNV